MSLIGIRSATITEKGQISIPKQIRDIEGLKTGSKVAILAFDNHIEIKSMETLNKEMATALASEKVLAKDWLSKEEDEAWKTL